MGIIDVCVHEQFMCVILCMRAILRYSTCVCVCVVYVCLDLCVCVVYVCIYVISYVCMYYFICMYVLLYVYVCNVLHNI